MNLSINLDISHKIGAPRTVFVRYPHGAPFGEPHARHQQMTVLRDLLHAAQEQAEPGAIVEPGYRWRRTVFHPVALSTFPRPATAKPMVPEPAPNRALDTAAQ